jgi:hypothetical protein
MSSRREGGQVKAIEYRAAKLNARFIAYGASFVGV